MINNEKHKKMVFFKVNPDRGHRIDGNRFALQLFEII
jgi:hypothetical protein